MLVQHTVIKRIFTIFLFLIFVVGCKKANVNYQINVKDFNKITAKEVKYKIDHKDPFLVYFGRESCEDCQNFVFTLKEKTADRKIRVNYVDTENAKEDSNLKELLADLKIDWVPSVMYVTYKNGKTVYIYYESDQDFSHYLDQLPIKNKVRYHYD